MFIVVPPNVARQVVHVHEHLPCVSGGSDWEPEICSHGLRCGCRDFGGGQPEGLHDCGDSNGVARPGNRTQQDEDSAHHSHAFSHADECWILPGECSSTATTDGTGRSGTA